MEQGIVISPSKMDLGKIEPNKERSFWFEVTNNTDQELDLKAWASCGCTTPQIVPSRIQPRGISKLIVKFDPTGKSGLQEKGIGISYFVDGVQKNAGATFIAKI
jgi:predicted nucleotidyltransferase